MLNYITAGKKKTESRRIHIDGWNLIGHGVIFKGEERGTVKRVVWRKIDKEGRDKEKRDGNKNMRITPGA